MSVVAYDTRRYGAVGGVPLGGAVGGVGGLGGAGVVPAGGVGVVGSRGFAGGAYGSGVYGGPVGGYAADDGCCGSGGGMVGGPGFGGGVGVGGTQGACGAGCGDACAAVGCGACGTAVGCGTGAGGAILTYVGAGGDYVQETTYRYVGGGAGTFGLVPVGTGTNCCLWIFPLGLCLLLLPLLFFLLPGTTTTTTTTTTFPTPPPTPAFIPTTTTLPVTTTPLTYPPTTPFTTVPLVPTTTTIATTTTIWQGPKKFCIIRGDPHLRTFDGQKASFYSQGEYWIVKSLTVFIQARYMPNPITHGLSVCKEIAIGGPFLGGKVLRISALHAFFNGVPILGGFPSQFQNKEPFVKALYNGEGGILQPGRGGKPMRVIHLELPMGIFIQVNRWNEPGEGDYINVKITMSAQPMQDGHCGNFNDNPEDDTRLAIRARVGTNGVDPGELLFRTKTPVHAPNRPDLNDCPKAKADHARQVCSQKAKDGMASQECMIDVCFGGDVFAIEDNA